MNDELLTPIEAASYLRIHRDTLYELIKRGLLPAFKVGGRWRIRKSALEQYERLPRTDGSAADTGRQ